MASDLTGPVPTRRRQRRQALMIALAIATLLTGLVVVLATRPPAASRIADSPLIGRPAPATVGDTIDGDTCRLEEDRGK